MMMRGASHVEMILSFVLFAAAITFALYFFSPGDSTRLVDSSLTYGFGEVEQNVSVVVHVFSVTVGNTEGNPIIGVDIGANVAGKSPRVEDSGGTPVESRRDSDIIYFRLNPGENFYTIKLNEEFSDSLSSGGTFNEDYYSISSSNTFEVISERRFVDLNSSYESDYLGLKEFFNLPSRVNFGFSLDFEDGTFVRTEKVIPEGLEVFSDKKRLEVLRKSGNSEFGELTIWVW